MEAGNRVKDQVVTDCLNRPIEVGSKIWLVGDDPTTATGEVTKITDHDADYDDNLQRGVLYCPKITVKYINGQTEEWNTYDINRSEWRDWGTPEFMSDDLEVID